MTWHDLLSNPVISRGVARLSSTDGERLIVVDCDTFSFEMSRHHQACLRCGCVRMY